MLIADSEMEIFSHGLGEKIQYYLLALTNRQCIFNFIKQNFLKIGPIPVHNPTTMSTWAVPTELCHVDRNLKVGVRDEE